MKAIRILAAAVFATFAVGAQADAFAPGGPGNDRHGAGMIERLKAADTNGDGKISREEAQASLPRLYEHFDEIDANKDGFITFEELRASHQAHRAARAEGWKHLDVNGDGMISRDEVANHPRLAQNFDAIDTNKDGLLSPEELRAARQAHSAAVRAGFWKRLDANGDGKLSREEVANHPRLAQEFDAIDTNKDGFLTIEELQAARGRFAGRGMGRPL